MAQKDKEYIGEFDHILTVFSALILAAIFIAMGGSLYIFYHVLRVIYG